MSCEEKKILCLTEESQFNKIVPQVSHSFFLSVGKTAEKYYPSKIQGDL